MRGVAVDPEGCAIGSAVEAAGGSVLAVVPLSGAAGSEHALEAAHSSSHTPQNLDRPVRFMLAPDRGVSSPARHVQSE
jgi:hypothetical protein